MNAPAASGPELAIEFALADDEVVLHKVLGAEAYFTCIKLTLHPEEGEQQWARAAKVQFPTELPAAAKLLPRKKAWRQKSVAKKAGAAPRRAGCNVRPLDRLQRFVNGGGERHRRRRCRSRGGVRRRRRPPSRTARSASIGAWNDRFFNVETAETRQNAEPSTAAGASPSTSRRSRAARASFAPRARRASAAGSLPPPTAPRYHRRSRLPRRPTCRRGSTSGPRRTARPPRRRGRGAGRPDGRAVQDLATSASASGQGGNLWT